MARLSAPEAQIVHNKNAAADQGEASAGAVCMRVDAGWSRRYDGDTPPPQPSTSLSSALWPRAGKAWLRPQP